MNNAQFWQLIEDAKLESDGDVNAQAEVLSRRLARFSPEDILAFDRIFSEYRALTYRWDLWGAAYIIIGGASDDAFDYFRGWLIAQGEDVYTNALRDSDSLANVLPPDTQVGDEELDGEEMLYVAMTAYQERTGNEMPDLHIAQPPLNHSRLGEPKGNKWESEDELDVLLPKLTARFPSLTANQEDDEEE